jgi:hypothetical protein
MTSRTPTGNMNLPPKTKEEQPVIRERWRRTTTKSGRQEVFTTGVPITYASTLEGWSQLLVVEGKIKTNSKYNAYRYATMIGITLIDQLMTAKYGNARP